LKKKILIFGGSSLLGTNFIYFLQNKYNFTFNVYNYKYYLKNLNFVRLFKNIQDISKKDIQKKIKKINPDIILNCLALSNVDKCEENIKESRLLNYEFSNILTDISYKLNIKYIFISTDQIYESTKRFKTENDKVLANNIYSKHKLLSEEYIQKKLSNFLIIRTNFFGHSPYHKKFTEELIHNINNNVVSNLFYNYFTTPIYVKYLVKAIHLLIKKNKKGLFNIVGNQRISKLEFAKKILSNFKNKKTKLLKKTNFFSYKFKAKRNNDLSLSNKKLLNKVNINIPNLNKQMKEFIAETKKINYFFDEKIPYGKHYIDKNDIESVVKVLKSGQLTQGDHIEKVEKIVSNYVGAKYAVAVSSCTAGLHLTYAALNVGKKKNIITSPISFVSTSNAAFYCDSKPYFSDIDKETINLSTKKLQENLNKSKNIGVIVPVHFAGLPCDMQKIYDIAKKNKLFVVEDAAHAIGAKYNCGSLVGSCKYSDACVFSFHPVKIVSSGEGGIITTNSLELYNKLLSLRSHGINKNNQNFINKNNAYTNNLFNPWYYEMQNLGYHYRQTDIHSGLLISQMEKINEFLNKRKKISANYDKFFINKSNISLPQKKFRHLSANHLYILNINFKAIKMSRAEFMTRLKKYGIITQVHYIPIPMHPYYKKKGYNLKNLNTTREFYKNCLSIPIYYDLNEEKQNFVKNSIIELTNFNL